ncbi:N-acetyltransferase [Rhizocola hellebori]|uniref:N-acetyltransferase n=1 Tax=Rhizocola hellebori TaxID=1392758 RepID=A0A8J3QAF3_9ACTN|nr:GNAT family N-acetyltransferase [Rhizocola hellebori]GIH06379.1 N-acetyltransferase [Rhizocola hellebori]
MIRQATKADVPALAVTLAEAFADDPVWNWLLPAAERKRRLFAVLLRYAVPKGHVYTVDSLEAVTIWSPPGGWKLPTSAMVRQALPMLYAAGSGLPRLLGRLGEIEKLHELVPPEHWYLDFIGTSNKARGQGLGSALLEDGLKHGLPVYLESSNPRNLSFYQRHGFQVTGEPVMKAGPPQWTLWRD